MKTLPHPAFLSKTLGTTFGILNPEFLLITYQVTELKHQKIGNCFYTLSNTLKDIWMLKNTDKNKS